MSFLGRNRMTSASEFTAFRCSSLQGTRCVRSVVSPASKAMPDVSENRLNHPLPFFGANEKQPIRA